MDIDSSMFDYDSASPLDMHDNTDNVTIRDITFDGGQGQRIEAYLVEPPASQSGPHPAVLWVHWLETFAENSNRAQFLPEAINLAREGVVSLLPSTFWSVVPVEWMAEWEANPGFWWKTEFEHDRDLSIRQTIELRRALDVLYQRDDVDKERVVYVGHDFGAMYGSLLLGSEKRVKAAVLMAGTTAFSDWFIFGSKLSDEKKAAYVEAMAILDPVRFIAQAGIPILFQFANEDFYVPVPKAEAFVAAAGPAAALKWYEAGHSMEDAKHESQRDRVKWVREQLGLS